MQTAPGGTYSGMLHCARGILKNEGVLAFYKVFFPLFCGLGCMLNSVRWWLLQQGTVPPLLGIGACVSIQFGALESTKRYLLKQNKASGKTSLNDSQIALSGCTAGLANGLVSGPVEHIRIRQFSY
jgi:solute carrier family 25 carnitine/acylcarnitine transporter 20/29